MGENPEKSRHYPIWMALRRVFKKRLLLLKEFFERKAAENEKSII
jgi:hypothetical protein